MQWDSGVDAGFSTAKTTWLPVAPSYLTRNVAMEEQDPNSLLNFYKRLIRLRKENEALRSGSFKLIEEAHRQVLSYVRQTPGGKTVLVALNFAAGPQEASYHLDTREATTLISSYTKAGQQVDVRNMLLPPYGVWVGQMN